MNIERIQKEVNETGSAVIDGVLFDIKYEEDEDATEEMFPEEYSMWSFGTLYFVNKDIGSGWYYHCWVKVLHDLVMEPAEYELQATDCLEFCDDYNEDTSNELKSYKALKPLIDFVETV